MFMLMVGGERRDSFAQGAWLGGFDWAFTTRKGWCAMETFLTVLLVWITPNVLFVGWRLWVSRPAGNDHRWEYGDSLARAPRHRSFGTGRRKSAVIAAFRDSR